MPRCHVLSRALEWDRIRDAMVVSVAWKTLRLVVCVVERYVGREDALSAATFPTAPPAPRKPCRFRNDTTTSPISTSDARRSREGPAARCSAASRQKHAIGQSSTCSGFSTPVPPTRVLGVPH